jgi:hypothetical protein
MLVISAPALLQLQSAIIAATHGLVGFDGKRIQIGTVNDKQLKGAALAAVLIATGETILPGDETINVDMPSQQSYGPFRINRG